VRGRERVYRQTTLQERREFEKGGERRKFSGKRSTTTHLGKRGDRRPSNRLLKRIQRVPPRGSFLFRGTQTNTRKETASICLKEPADRIQKEGKCAAKNGIHKCI